MERNQITVDGVEINNDDSIRIIQVVEMVIRVNYLPTIKIDFGQQFFLNEKMNNSKIKVNNNIDIVFKSIVEAMNFFENNGWEYLSTHKRYIETFHAEFHCASWRKLNHHTFRKR